MTKQSTATYKKSPVTGYPNGLVIAENESPIFSDNNHWFYIGGLKINVHPYRRDLGGYPVRWTQKQKPPVFTDFFNQHVQNGDSIKCGDFIAMIHNAKGDKKATEKRLVLYKDSIQVKFCNVPKFRFDNVYFTDKANELLNEHRAESL